MSRVRNPSRAIACLSLAAIAVAGSATVQAKPKPPKPKPKITLLTSSQESALRKQAIKVEVDSARGEKARVKANFVVDGYPEDFAFRLGPEKKRLRGGEARVRLKLSPRQREVLDFAIKSCRPATLSLRAEVGRGSDSLDASLSQPSDC